MAYNKNHQKWLIFTICLVSVCGILGQLPPEDMERIDNLVEEVLECSGIPGLTLAAAKDGQVAIAKGYGKANLEQGIDVDENTKFNIASVTKEFTGTLLARLLNMSDSFTWNTPVRDIIGDWFHLYNGYYSNHTTLRDQLAMKTGVPENDIIWLLDVFDREEQAERLRFLTPIYPFRTDYLYNNLMYVAAGVAAEVMGGATWEDLITDLLFEPIGMSSSTFMNRAPADYEGYATPYLPFSEDGPLEPVPVVAYQGARSAGPAASIVSNAVDMSKWLLFWLNDATTEDGNILLTQQEIAKFLAPEFSLNELLTTVEPNFPILFAIREKYAKGFLTGFYRGYQILSHGGSNPGYYSFITLLRDMGVGSFVSVNGPQYGIRDYILAFVNDILLEEEPWITSEEICNMIPHMKENYKNSDNPDRYFLPSKSKIAAHNLNRKDIRTVKVLEGYTGSYGNFGYGNATVILNLDTESLELEFGNIGLFDLLPTEDEDEFVAQGRDGSTNVYYIGLIVFSHSQGDIVDTLVMSEVEPSYPIRFVRDRKISDAPLPDIESCE